MNKKAKQEKSKVYVASPYFYGAMAPYGRYDYGQVDTWMSSVGVNLKELDLVLVPINTLRNHWELLAIDLKGESLKLYGSIANYGGKRVQAQAFRVLKRWIRDESKAQESPIDPGKWSTDCPKAPQQSNACDCGIFMLQFARELVHAVAEGDDVEEMKFSVSQSQIPALREGFRKEIRDALNSDT